MLSGVKGRSCPQHHMLGSLQTIQDPETTGFCLSMKHSQQQVFSKTAKYFVFFTKQEDNEMYPLDTVNVYV